MVASVGSIGPFYSVPILDSEVTFRSQFEEVPATQSYTHRDPNWQGVYLFTNEVNGKETIQTLEDAEERGDTLIGVSGFFNFDLFLARESKGVKYVINIDPVPVYRDFWQLVEETIKTADNAEDFYDTIGCEINGDQSKFYSEPFLQTLHLCEYLEACRIYWLQRIDSKEKFSKLKNLFSEGRFLHHPVDLADSNGVKDLIFRLEELGHRPDTVYVSNVCDCLPDRRTREDFQNNVKILGQQNAYVVDAGRYIAGNLFRAPEILRQLHQRVADPKAE